MNLIDTVAQPRVLLACLCFGFVNLLLAKGEQRFGEQWSAHNLSGDRTRVHYETAILFFQISAILLYTLKLGEQLH